MDLRLESAPGEGPAVSDDSGDEVLAEGVKLPLDLLEAPSRLDGFDSAALLEALEPDEAGDDDAAAADAEGGEGEVSPDSLEEEDEGEDDEDGEADGLSRSRKPPQRLSVRGLPAEQQFQLAEALDLLRRGEARNLRAALSRVGGGSDDADKASESGQPFGEYELPQETGDSTEPAGIQQRIRTLREQRRQAIEDFDRPTEARLTEEIEDLQLDLLRAEQAGHAREAEARTYQESYLSAVDAMEARYPEALDEQSAFHRILDNKIAAAQARRDPALGDPDFILQFADEVAAMLGGHGAAPRPGAQRSRPVGSALAPGHQSSGRPSRDQMSRMIHEMPLEELERLVCTE